MPSALPPNILSTISVIERVGSVFSLIGCLFIIFTFASSRAFHKPINRLVFYASFGNVMTSVATLIARAYVHSINTFGCQFQGLLIQTFLPADALWTLAMALNVYLTFYHKYDAQKLRKIEKWYLLMCYGAPLIPGLAFIFISKKPRGRIYGDATLWCWISSGWDFLRIAIFYGPVWVVILATFFIYIRAGREIFRRRKQLHNFGVSSVSFNDPETPVGSQATKTTEVHITSESADRTPDSLQGATSDAAPAGSSSYSVTISSDRPSGAPSALDAAEASAFRARTRARRRNNFELNNAAWSYTKCALLFFTALLVTWIPSSANRVYSVIHVGDTSVVLEIMSAIVLPLQGFWNAVIYAVTSWTAVKAVFTDLARRPARLNVSRGQYPSRPDAQRRNFSWTAGGRAQQRKMGESDSMTELSSTVPQMTDGDDRASTN